MCEFGPRDTCLAKNDDDVDELFIFFFGTRWSAALQSGSQAVRTRLFIAHPPETKSASARLISSLTRTDEAAVDCRAEPRPVDDACTRIHTHDVVRAQTVEPRAL